MVAFSLLLLVAADVLETLLKPGHEYAIQELCYKIAWIGGIRTTLAYFLGKETEEIMHHIAHGEEVHNGHHHEEETTSVAEAETETKAETSSRPPNSRKNKRKQKKQ
mmetsp:Transcript_17985/g.49935  ORF Transcript_17985/g.49935 Transcript_17985/m.49935 type:complete len:107 (-) Transcript_17985:1165-1485(-)